MFREMRRSRQALSAQACLAVLEEGTAGVLALCGNQDYPYAVPLSYVYHDGKIYFHCAQTGHKLEAIADNDKASFCVVGQDLVAPERYTTYFRSVIAFGRVRVLTDGVARREALERLAAKYSPAQAQGRQREIDQQFDRVCMLELTIEHITGKQAIELVDGAQS